MFMDKYDIELTYQLGWEAQLNIDKMCEDSWNWQSNNPEGYK
jgi:UDP-glucose 4-epimerase